MTKGTSHSSQIVIAKEGTSFADLQPESGDQGSGVKMSLFNYVHKFIVLLLCLLFAAADTIHAIYISYPVYNGNFYKSVHLCALDIFIECLLCPRYSVFNREHKSHDPYTHLRLLVH